MVGVIFGETILFSFQSKGIKIVGKLIKGHERFHYSVNMNE